MNAEKFCCDLWRIQWDLGTTLRNINILDIGVRIMPFCISGLPQLLRWQRIHLRCMRPGSGRQDPPEKETATHSSILARRIPRTEAPSGLQSTGRKEWDVTQQLTLSVSEVRGEPVLTQERNKGSRCARCIPAQDDGRVWVCACDCVHFRYNAQIPGSPTDLSINLLFFSHSSAQTFDIYILMVFLEGRHGNL